MLYAALMLAVIYAVPRLADWWAGRGDADVHSPYSHASHTLPLLSDAQRQRLLQAAERAVRDAAAAGAASADFDAMPHRAYVVLWRDGRRLSSHWSSGDNLERTVMDAAAQAASGLPDRAGQPLVHIQVMGRDRPLDDGGYRHGRHGLNFIRTKQANYFASYAMETKFREQKLLERLAQRLASVDTGDAPMRRFYYAVDHFGRGPDGGLVTYYMGSTPALQAGIDRDAYAAMVSLARAWLVGNVADSGPFRYLYYPSRNEWPASRNNVLRQLMASRTLAQLSREDPSLRSLHQRNLAYVFREWYRQEQDRGFILYRDKSKLGALAMALRTLVYSPFYEDYEAQARALVNGILWLRNPDGGFRAWYREPDYPFNEERLLFFYSGEALLALAAYAALTGDQAVLGAAEHSQAHYLARYVAQIDRYYYPAYVPWHVQSLNALYAITGTRDYLLAAMTLTDRVLDLQDPGATEPYYRGRFFNPATPQYGSPHASSDAVYTEGLAHAVEMAHALGDEARVTRYSNALTLALANLDNLQYRGPRRYFSRCIPCVEGAFRIHATDNKVRVDSTQHALDAFLKVDALMANKQFSLP